MDWTPNPLVALYFACRSSLASDGAIWAFTKSKSLVKGESLDIFDPNKKPLDIAGVRLVYPFDISPRMTVQSSYFTIQDNPQKKLEEYNPDDYASNPADFDIAKLVKWKIPVTSKTKILEYLDRHSVNTRTLFPDLDGIATGIWQAEVLRYGNIKSPEPKSA